MSDQPHPGSASLSPSLVQRIDEVCDRFEDAWKGDQRPQLEHYLDDVPEPERSLLLRHLLLVELECRCESGETLVVEDYVQRFPEHADLIRAVFAEQIAGERSKESDSSEHLTSTGLEGNRPREVDRLQRLGRYRITGTLGEGGFGVVYKGYDDELRRDVAIKVPHRHRVSQPQDVEAYLAEARVLASLDHPHIVPVYDVGRTEDGLCFVVSKFIEGSDLKAKIREARPSYAESAELVAVVAEALHYAHRKGLVHRDVKPGNILLDTSGKPHVADFGLALREEDFGRGSTFAGTPAYMSPEQARGEGHRVDGRSDIFSLGVVFYELLTGRRPFRGETGEQLLEQIASAEPRPPRQIEDTLPKELERICLKALSKRASDRYTTAKDMAEDLWHFLDQSSEEEKSALGTTDPRVGPFRPQPTVKPTVRTAPDIEPTPDKIVPKGLRSFDANDADFFLELLPGPRDRDGLPQSIRFWKTRIEETDPDKTFAVGLLYGPSGCGKSSLVKAGLLPRLADHVITIYIEATAEGTEARLLRALRRNCPRLRGDLRLAENLAALRRKRGLDGGQKVLIVLDQFEQWLHAKRTEKNAELVHALRQCDGERVQCIVMVRDDFWLAVSRFMRELEVQLLEGQNSALVDLFDPDHANKVLVAFGSAFGRVPQNWVEITKEQKEFLKRAVNGLAQEGKIICIRLALFAEMMKGKAWTPATLKATGGTEGVGLTFLEETFCAATAPPEHRLHQSAARAVLKALLPETGADIRGHVRSYAELLAASGYGSRAKDFEELLHILDRELRLITPTDPEGSEMDGGIPSRAQAGQKFYQLTHDYLVPSLREWLTRKQKETPEGYRELLLAELASWQATKPAEYRRLQQTLGGRAELRLAERTLEWNAKQENRYLPSWREWASIRLLTRPRHWTASQRKMMAKATRHYAVWSSVFVITLVLLGWGGFQGFGNLMAQWLKVRLVIANTSEIPAIVAEIAPYRRWLDPLLREAYAEAERSGDARK